MKLSGGIECVLPCDVPASLAVRTALLSLASLNQEYAAHLLLAGVLGFGIEGNRNLGHWYRGQPKVVSPFRFHYERAHFKSWGCPPRKKTFFGAQITPPSRSHKAQARPKGSRLGNFLIVKKVANQNQFGQWGSPLHANLGILCRSKKKSVKVNVCKGVPPFWERPKRKGFFLGGLPIGGFRIP